MGEEVKAAIKEAVKSWVKAHIPLIAGIIAGLVLLFAIIGMFMDDAEGAQKSDEDETMQQAVGDQWEFFVDNYVKSWEGHEGKSADGKKYKIGGVLGNRTVGYGIDLETSGAEPKLKALGYDTSMGSYIDCDVVDELTNDELKSWYDLVKKSMSSNGVSAKEYQVYAFTDFCYNCGHVGDFYENNSVGKAYKDHYDDKVDDWYGDYTKTSFSEPIAAKFIQYDTGLSYNQRRRHADASLFQTGYYGYDLHVSGGEKGIDAYYTESIGGAGLTTYTLNGTEYEILANAEAVSKQAIKSGYHQSNGKYPDLCLGLSYVEGHAVATGDMSNIKAGKVGKNGDGNADLPGIWGNSITSSSKQSIVERVYDEVSQGIPCILQVIGSRSHHGRHYVVAVGYKEGVTKENVKDTDLLILDDYNGQLREVVAEGASSGRYIFDANKENPSSYNYHYQCIVMGDKARNKIMEQVKANLSKASLNGNYTGEAATVQAFLKQVQTKGVKCNLHKISMAPGVTYNHRGEQCKGYGKCLFEKCFGITPGSTNSNKYTLSSVSGMELVGTASNQTEMKNLFAKARPGDFIQMRRGHGGPHSAIVYDVNADGTTWMENNTDGHCGTFLNTYSWSRLAEKNAYISIYTATNYKLK